MTTRELAMLARHIILNYPEYYPIFGEREFTWNKIRQQNRNPLLGIVTAPTASRPASPRRPATVWSARPCRTTCG